jgi:hypothetical protein
MNKLTIYPSCARSFRYFIDSYGEKDKKFMNKYVTRLLKVKPFDVTLRDGLQGLSKEQQLTMKPVDMLNLYFQIKEKYQPRNMEIGSIVSSKVLPIFKNSDSFYNYIEYCQLNPDEPKINNFILIPNETQFNNINKFIGLNCFSFITSVSESFQMKNTKMTLDTTFQQINNMMRVLDDKPEKSTVKLYVSCINECPIEGKIDNNVIIEKIQKYQKLKPDILCLSDTCGTLTSEDLNYIILNLQRDGIKNDYSNLSLHLHVKPGREDEVEKIIHTALDFGINSFDVSTLKSGGCSVTMNESDLAPNLSYELYYKSLATYLLKDK